MLAIIAILSDVVFAIQLAFESLIEKITGKG